MLGIAGHAHKHWGEEYNRTTIVARVLALLVMLTSILVAIYAAGLYVWRAVALRCAALQQCCAFCSQPKALARQSC
jgi:hypothetical protein